MRVQIMRKYKNWYI